MGTIIWAPVGLTMIPKKTDLMEVMRQKWICVRYLEIFTLLLKSQQDSDRPQDVETETLADLCLLCCSYVSSGGFDVNLQWEVAGLKIYVGITTFWGWIKD